MAVNYGGNISPVPTGRHKFLWPDGKYHVKPPPRNYGKTPKEKKPKQQPATPPAEETPPGYTPVDTGGVDPNTGNGPGTTSVPGSTGGGSGGGGDSGGSSGDGGTGTNSNSGGSGIVGTLEGELASYISKLSEAKNNISVKNTDYNLTNGLPSLNLGNFQYGQGPNMGQFGGSGLGQLNNLYQSATQGTLQSYDTAANRLRERLNASGKASMEGLKQRGLSSGLGATGMLSNQMMQQDLNNQFAYGQGLSQLADQFEGRRLQGLGIAKDAADTTTSAQLQDFLTRRQEEGLNFRDSQKLEYDKLKDMDELLERMKKNRADDMLQRELGRAGVQGDSAGSILGLLQGLLGDLIGGTK